MDNDIPCDRNHNSDLRIWRYRSRCRFNCKNNIFYFLSVGYRKCDIGSYYHEEKLISRELRIRNEELGMCPG